jgi:hypothetical protein
MDREVRKQNDPRAPIQYIIEGGHRLSGTIEPSGNKSAALPIIAAALLTEHPSCSTTSRASATPKPWWS